jgi:hypothetical protein
MSRAQRRLSERQQAKVKRSEARRAAAFERRTRQRERWAGASKIDFLGVVGDLLAALAAPQIAVLLGPLALIGRLMGIDTSEKGPRRKRPEWMPAPEQASADRNEHGSAGPRASS